MKKIRIGVLGAYRGTSMINYCKRADNAEIVAICDKDPEAINAQCKAAEGMNIYIIVSLYGTILPTVIRTIGETICIPHFTVPIL